MEIPVSLCNYEKNVKISLQQFLQHHTLKTLLCGNTVQSKYISQALLTNNTIPLKHEERWKIESDSRNNCDMFHN